MEFNPALRTPEEPGKWLSAGMAALVHLVLLGILFWGVNWQRKAPESFEVALVRANTPSVASEPPPPPPPPREVTPTPPPKPAPEIEAEPPKPVAKPDIALPTPKPEKKPEKKPEPKPELKPEPKPEPKPKPDSKPEKREPQPDLRAAAEAETRAVQAKAAREAAKVQQDRALKEEMARLSGAKSDRARDDWVNKIRVKVRGNIVVPPGLSGNPEAVFIVEQLPTGEVMDVRLKTSSGNATLDGSIERAIRKSSPLPLPEKNDLFERRLELAVRPLQQ
ncbi:energy transducer TonB [Niveibacterium sp.]|uniref:energy transducer TonB n=1 Tax=Niveibacterium sp. TaxID=2017444 RepID=UPI0035B1E4E1